MTDHRGCDRSADDWWDTHHLPYLPKRGDDLWRVPYFRQVLAETSRSRPHGACLLDVGCGSGLLSEEFAALGYRVTGLDPSPSTLAAARAHAAALKLPIEYRWGAGEFLPFEDASFEVVVCRDVLEHLPAWSAVVAEAARVLKPGGIFLYASINRAVKSKRPMARLNQVWSRPRFAPPNLRAREMFVTRREFQDVLARYDLHSRGMVSASEIHGVLRTPVALRHLKAGKISAAQFGRRADLSGNFMGYAVK